MQLLPSSNANKKFWLLLFSAAIVLSSIIPLKLAMTLSQVPMPQGILVLDGETRRVKFAAEFSRSHPRLDIWLSGNCSQSARNSRLFQQAGIPAERVQYDLRATDTVTHFTAIAKDFVAQDIRHVYLITSDYHMRRATAIAVLVLGSRGIVITPVSVPSKNVSSETLGRVLRDCLRSIVWIITGHSGASLNPDLNPCPTSPP